MTCCEAELCWRDLPHPQPCSNIIADITDHNDRDTHSVARRPVLPPDDLARPALDDACAGGEVWQVGGAGDVEVEGAELLALPAHSLQLLQHRAHARVQAEVSTWR